MKNWEPGEPDWTPSPWLREQEAYGRDDPKHPDFLESWLDYADMLRKREKEDGPIHDDNCWIACPHSEPPKPEPPDPED